MKTKADILYISYNGLLEPILDSQAVPYMRDLNAKFGIRFVLFTFEKSKDLLKYGHQKIMLRKENLRKMGIEWVWIKYHKRPQFLAKPVDFILGVLVTFALALIYRVRCIHARTAVGGIMAMLPAKIMCRKFLFDMRASLSDEAAGAGLLRKGGLRHFLLAITEKILLMSSDGIVVLTKRHYSRLQAQLDAVKRRVPVEIIPCCVDMDRFKFILPDKFANPDGKKFTFMYLGKFGPLYLIDKILDYFLIYKMAVPNSQLLVATQDDPGYIYNICRHKDVNINNISVYAPEFDEIPKLISKSDCGIFFINPEKKFASSPVKMGEFLSCGVPVVTNRGIGDTEELISKNRVGVIVKDFSIEGYREASENLQSLLAERDALRYRCRKTAEETLSLHMGVTKYYDIYNTLGVE